MLLSNPFTHDPRVYNEARGLVRAGHTVTMVAWDRAGEAPVRETVKGVRVERVRHTPWMRMLPFDLLRLRGWWRAAARRTLDVHAETPVDVVHCHDLDTLPAGLRLKGRLGVPVVYDAHEIFGHMLARDLPQSVAGRFLRLEARLAPQVDQIVVENRLMKEYMDGLTGGKIPVAIVMNAKHVPAGPWVPPPEGPCTALYIGTLNKARFLEGVLDAAHGLGDDIEVVVGGLGKPDYVAGLRARIEAHPRASFLGKVPPAEVVPRTRDAHVVLCLTDPADINNRIATANKQFEAMAAGRPILVSEGTFLAEFTEEHEVGLAVPHTVDGVREGLARLCGDPALAERLGRTALQKGQTRFNWEEQERVLVAAYGRLGAPAGPEGDPWTEA